VKRDKQCSETRSPWAVTLSWQHSYISKMTYEPSKLGQTDLVFGLSSEFNRSVYPGLQVNKCSGQNWCHPG